ADVQGGRAVQLVGERRDVRAGRRGSWQQLRWPELVVQGGELGRRKRRAIRVQRAGHRGEQPAGLELAPGRLEGLQVVPCGLLELVDDVRRVGRRVREVGGEDIGAGRRVRA